MVNYKLKNIDMEYHYLGNSGLQVSRLGLGAIPFGTAMDEKDSQRALDIFWDVGGNLVDTANLYGGGSIGTNTAMAGISERTLGRILKGKRDKLVIATKGYWLMEDEVTPNSVGLGRTYLSKQIDESLRRLQTDYIDLYQCHSWDFYTPVGETMRVLDDFVRGGKIRYVGVSNWDGWHVVKANAIAKVANLTPVISNQIWYNLADRVAENSIVPACRDQNVSIIAWGALATGFLSGRYRRGAAGPAGGTRLGSLGKESESSSWKTLAVDRNWDTLEVLFKMAQQTGRTVSNVAMRWVLQSGFCDVVLLGGSKLTDYESALDMLKFELTAEEVRQLTEVSRPPRPYPNNFWELFCVREGDFYGGLR